MSGATRCTCVRADNGTMVGAVVVPDLDCPALALHIRTGR